jgi:predicted membrane chloride channel (bestrophin family)
LLIKRLLAYLTQLQELIAYTTLGGNCLAEKVEKDMNNSIRELNIDEIEAVSGGQKASKLPPKLDAALNSIDLSDSWR